MSEASGWGIVPPTILRDGPFGEGMVQAFVEADPEVDVVAMVVEDDPRLRRMAVLRRRREQHRPQGRPHPPGRRWRARLWRRPRRDFSPVPKLRTVLWGWRGEPLADDELDGLARVRAALDDELGAALRGLLSRLEVRATTQRVDRLLAERRFPLPSPTWPAIPWPPF